MKKFAALIAVAVLVAIAAPALAATNPFMDVPMNHWAYDAIGQLAAKGVLSGYPDGTYKGKQPTTRYEMASALARALALVDMTKASKQDVEMLKKLVIEFKDELDALGVRVDELDRRVSVIESRLGGWKIGGWLRLDIEDWDDDEADGDVNLARARVYMERWFGQDESLHFYARFNGHAGAMTYDKFYVEIPTWWDTTLTVGRFLWDMEADYYLNGTTAFSPVGYGHDSWLTDRSVDGMGITKSFGGGKFSAYVAHPNMKFGLAYAEDGIGATYFPVTTDFEMWELFAMAQLQFSEKFGLDIGGQAFFGDDSSIFSPVGTGWEGYKFDNLWTIFAGLRFNFNDNIQLKGLYYYQDSSLEFMDYDTTGRERWYDVDTDSNSAYRIILDVKQEQLSFTSLWLEYDHLDQGFILPTGMGALWLTGNLKDGDAKVGSMVLADLDIWRVGARQVWNDKWATYEYVAGHTYNDVVYAVPGGYRRTDAKATQWAVGVSYFYNPAVVFDLMYTTVDWDSDGEKYFGRNDNHLLRLRTQVTF